MASPSVWREWIEIVHPKQVTQLRKSPSVWREWIEMPHPHFAHRNSYVSLRVEGVD